MKTTTFLLFVVLGVTSSAEASRKQNEQWFTVSVQAANIRFQPSTESRVIGRAERGTVLRVIGRERKWLKVSYFLGPTERVGYIAGWLGSIETIAVPSVGSSRCPDSPCSSWHEK